MVEITTILQQPYETGDLIPLQSKTIIQNVIQEDQLNELVKIEQQQTENDTNILNCKNDKNELESCCYDLKNSMQVGSLKELVDEDEALVIENEIQKVLMWLKDN